MKRKLILTTALAVVMSANFAAATLVGGWSTDNGGGGTLTEPTTGTFLYANATGGAAHAASFSATTLGIGDTLTFSGIYSNTVFSSGQEQIRFGLENNTVGTASGTAGWAGYFFADAANNPDGVWERGTTGNYWSVVTGGTLLSPSVAATGTYGQATSIPLGTYSFSLSYTRVSATTLQLNWDLNNTADSTGTAVSGVYDFTGSVTDTSVTTFTFNKAVLFSNGSGFTGTIGAYNLDVSLTPVPEPTTLSMIGLGFGALVVTMCRRKV